MVQLVTPVDVRALCIRAHHQLAHFRRLAFLLVLLITWQVVAESGLFKAVFMPPLQVISARFIGLVRNGVLIEAAAASLGRLGAGFCLATILGISLGILISRMGTAERMAVGLLSALLATPAVAWTPLFMLWFGLGNSATIALIVFVATVPIALNTWSGMRAVDPIFIRVAESMNVHGLRRLYKVQLPAAFAPTLAGVRLGFARGWHGLVAGEMLAGVASGLGALVTKASAFIDTPSMISALLTIAILAYLTEKVIFERIELLTLRRRGLGQMT